MKRELHKGKRPILIRFPDELVAAIDLRVEAEDLDRSKFIRAAVREKLERLRSSQSNPQEN